MPTKRHPRFVFALLRFAAACLLAAAAGCASPVGQALRNRAAPATANEIGGYATLEIESTPDGALIAVNGRLLGPAPITYRYEIDSLGDVALDLDITADFSDAPGINRNQAPPVVSHRVGRGDRAVTSVSFDTDSAISR